MRCTWPGHGGVVPTLGITAAKVSRVSSAQARLGVWLSHRSGAGSGPGARRYGLCALHTPHLHPHPHSPHSVTNNNTLSRDNKTARIRYACSPCNSMTSAAFSGALRSHAASMHSCPSCSRRALCTLCLRSACQLRTPARCAHPARYALRSASREDVACVCPLPCRAGETLSSVHARQAVAAAVRSSAARGIRRAHRDFGAPPSRHLHHDLGGNDTAQLSKLPVVRVAPARSSASTTLA